MICLMGALHWILLTSQIQKDKGREDENGFMNIPEGINEELPFHQYRWGSSVLKEGVNTDGADRDSTG